MVNTGMKEEIISRFDSEHIVFSTTRKRPTSGAPVLPTNGALLVRH